MSIPLSLIQAASSLSLDEPTNQNGCCSDMNVPLTDHPTTLQVQLVSAGYDLDPEDHLQHDVTRKMDGMETFLDNIQRVAPKHSRAYFAEFIGTFLMVLFGIGSVSVAVLTGALQGLWQVASIWAFGVAISIYITAPISGAHLNPAVTLTAWIFQSRTDFAGWQRMIGYQIAQYLGAFLAGGVNLGLWSAFIQLFEQEHNIVRGQPNSVLSAMIFHQYFPNYAISVGAFKASAETLNNLVPVWQALLVEAFGTAILTLAIFTMTDKCNNSITRGLEPLMIGFTVAILIGTLAPITQAGWNPARDFGPRLVAFIAGWGNVAIPGPKDGFWIYLVGPYIGAPIGAAIALFFLQRPRDTCLPHEKCE